MDLYGSSFISFLAKLWITWHSAENEKSEYIAYSTKNTGRDWHGANLRTPRLHRMSVHFCISSVNEIIVGIKDFAIFYVHGPDGFDEVSAIILVAG